jgi:hypothetical protein
VKRTSARELLAAYFGVLRRSPQARRRRRLLLAGASSGLLIGVWLTVACAGGVAYALFMAIADGFHESVAVAVVEATAFAIAYGGISLAVGFARRTLARREFSSPDRGTS